MEPAASQHPSPTHEDRPSQLAMIAAACAGLSLLLELIGCCCGIGVLGIPVGLGGAVVGFLEYQKIGRGELSEKSKIFAMIGMAGGALSLLYGIALIAMMILGVGANLLQVFRDR